jgi:hypothetical protein
MLERLMIEGQLPGRPGARVDVDSGCRNRGDRRSVTAVCSKTAVQELEREST